MNTGNLAPISLQYMPHPGGDNRLDIDIREGYASATYYASSHATGGSRFISILFKNCYAIRYVVTEDHESLCPGIEESESEFVEIRDSPWILSLPSYVQRMKHYAFGLNHGFFECIADTFEVQPTTQ